MFGILDVVTDFIFATTLYNNANGGSLFWWAVAFIAMPMAANLALGVLFLVQMSSKGDPDWVVKHHGSVALVVLLSLTDVESLAQLSSGLFGWGVFSANWPGWALDRLTYIGLIPIFFEDIPQIVIQAIVLSDQLNPAAVVSMFVSVLSIAHALLARLFLARARAASDWLDYDYQPVNDIPDK